jgi:hypothetical protein
LALESPIWAKSSLEMNAAWRKGAILFYLLIHEWHCVRRMWTRAGGSLPRETVPPLTKKVSPNRSQYILKKASFLSQCDYRAYQRFASLSVVHAGRVLGIGLVPLRMIVCRVLELMLGLKRQRQVLLVVAPGTDAVLAARLLHDGNVVVVGHQRGVGWIVSESE